MSIWPCFPYKKINSPKNHIGDKILSKSGAIFFSVLSKEPLTLDELAKQMNTQFVNVDINTIKNDAWEFYCMLEQDGFVVSGATLQECEEKDTKFSYKNTEPETITNLFSMADVHPEIPRRIF